MILTYKYRLMPSKRQHEALATVLESQRLLYNAALEERIGCYRATGRGKTYVDQCAGLTICRRELPEMAALSVYVQRWTLRRLNDAYKSFFQRLKERRSRAGFPRFRGRARWGSFGFSEFRGVRLKGHRLELGGQLGNIRVHFHRPLPSKEIRSCVFKREGRRWWVCFHVDVEAAPAQEVRFGCGD